MVPLFPALVCVRVKGDRLVREDEDVCERKQRKKRRKNKWSECKMAEKRGRGLDISREYEGDINQHWYGVVGMVRCCQ
jgi:hypothetical protein